MRAVYRVLANQVSVVYVLGSLLLIAFGALLSTTQAAMPLYFSVGTSITATGVASIVMYFYAVLQPAQAARLENIAEFGVAELFEHRDAAVLQQFDERLRRASHNVDVLGLGQRAFLGDHITEFEALSRRATVRILLLDPDFPDKGHSFASQRDGEENDEPGKIAHDVADFLKRTHDLRTGSQKDGCGFQVRLYRAVPTISLLRIDGSIYWNPYLVCRSRRTPMMRVGRYGVLFQRLSEHFDLIWNSDTLSVGVPEKYDDM